MMINPPSGVSRNPDGPAEADGRTPVERALLAIVADFLRELHPLRPGGRMPGLDSAIEKDLGIDSLARTELAMRLERRLGATVPLAVVGEAITIADLAAALSPAPSPDPGRGVRVPPRLYAPPGPRGAALHSGDDREAQPRAPAARLARSPAAIAYAAWWWTVLGTVACLGWLAIMVLRGRSSRWRVARTLARLALAAIGTRPTVVGAQHIPAGGAVLALNHASYLDTLLLSAILPGEPVFTSKREFAGWRLSGAPLRRLGVHFVHRYDAVAAMADVSALADRARHGELIVFFPEGGLAPRRGLAGFHLGAFKVAADAGVPVVPGTIRGARAMLQVDEWFPRRSPLRVHFREPIAPPAAADLASIVTLRDAARAAILTDCEEPDVVSTLPLKRPGTA